MEKTTVQSGRKNRGFNTRSLLLGFLLLLTFGAAPVMAASGPVEVLQAMTDRLQEVVAKDPGILDDYASMRAIVNELVVPNVNFPIMSRLVLGKHWRAATAEQRANFGESFKEVLIRTYLSSLGDTGGSENYEGQVIRYLPLKNQDPGNKIIVRAEVDQPNASPIDVRFRMLKKKNVWKIYDVIVEGISLVATNRSGYSAIIRKEGLAEFLVRLEAKEAALNNPDSAVQVENEFE